MKYKTKKSKTLATSNVVEDVDATSWMSKIGDVLGILIGFGIALYLGYRYAVYSKELHENDMWFSNIKVRLNSLTLLNH